MTAKKYLQSIEKHKKMIQHRRERIAEIRASLGIAGIDYSKDLISATGTNAQEEKLITLLDMIDDLERQQASLEYQILEAEERINQLPKQIYCDILYERYVNCKRLERIAVDLNYDYDYIRHQHGDALIAFEKKHHKYLRRTWK